MRSFDSHIRSGFRQGLRPPLWTRRKLAWAAAATQPAPIENPAPASSATTAAAERAPGRASLAAGMAVWMAVLLIPQAVACVMSLNGASGARALYWGSYALIVLSGVGAQFVLRPSRGQRLAIVVITGLALYFIKVLSYPTVMTYFDELSHLRTAHDLLRFGNPFHANPALKASPFYPGLEIVTAALARLTGLSLTACGLIVIGVGRVAFGAALFALFARAGRSARVGGLAAVLYMANPSFLYFDSDFSYESFALPLAALTLAFTLMYMEADDRRARVASLGGALAAASAVIVSHHATSYLLTAFLLVLSLAALVARRWGSTARVPWPIATWAVALTAAWLIFVAPSTVAYLGQVFGPAIDGARNVLFGAGAARAPFSGGTTAAVDPLWLRLLGYGSVLTIVASLPLGSALLWRRRSQPWALASAVVAVSYLPVQLLRLTGAGVESANRAAEFLFFGIAFELALCFIHLTDAESQPVAVWIRKRRLIGRRHLRAYAGGARSVRAGLLAAAVMLFLGGVVVLWPPYGRLPGRYLPGADVRSISAQGIRAAEWLEAHYGPGQRVLTDRSNAQIVAAYAEATPVEGNIGANPVARVFTSSVFDGLDRHLIQSTHVRFILVDTRLSSGLPVRGFYYAQNELPGSGWAQPIPLSVLTKFARAPGLSLVYNSGPVQIYDTQGITGS